MTTDVHIEIDPDIGPLGYPRKREVEPYPREMQTMTIPITWPCCATLTYPARMSPEEWGRLMDWLALARSAATR